MSTQYEGTATWAVDYSIPSGGDLRNASSVNVPLEALGDRTVWLRGRSVQDTYKTDTFIAATALGQFSTASYADIEPTGFAFGSEEPYLYIEHVEVGDQIVLNFRCYAQVDSGDAGHMRLEIHDDYEGTPNVVTPNAATVRMPASWDGPVDISYVHGATESGVTKVILQGKRGASGAGVVVVEYLSMSALHIKGETLGDNP